jgi:hypothetical protein
MKRVTEEIAARRSCEWIDVGVATGSRPIRDDEQQPERRPGDEHQQEWEWRSERPA